MAEVVEGYDFVVEVSWLCIDAAFGPMMALASASIGEGCRRYIVTLRASPVLC
jgi:hypothetical protein